MRKRPFLKILPTLLIVFLMLVTASFAWFSGASLVPEGAEVVLGYFAGGSGTATDPYIISKPVHLYNFAWLQNTGRFNKTYDEDGNLVPYHFAVTANLNMAGYVLPPIGTAEYPFIGKFNGVDTKDGKVVISDLTVSNILAPSEITKRPQSVTHLEGVEIVGMFGIVGQYNGVPANATYTNIVPSVTNFLLNDPVIRTQTEQSLMGLIAGYVNGKVHEVGVYGGTLLSGAPNTLPLGTNKYLSYYALIGDRHADVSWGGVSAPGNEGGGAIRIDPNDPTQDADFVPPADDREAEAPTLIEKALEEVQENGYAAVPESLPGHSYFVGKNITFGESASPATMYMYYKLLTTSDTTIQTGSNRYVQFTASNYATKAKETLDANMQINSDFETRLKDGGSNTLSFGDTVPKPNVTENVTLPDGSTLPIPTGGLWFKPVDEGDCLISFLVTNMSSSRYKSIYRFTRGKNNAIENWTEIEITFAKQQPFKQRNLALYHFRITEDDINAKYEFVIGNPSNTKRAIDCYFYFLALAGASKTGGGEITEDSKELFEVNFIDAIPYTYNSGTIAGNGTLITTFTVARATTGSAASVSFRRSAMTVHAELNSVSAALTIKRYEHKSSVAAS